VIAATGEVKKAARFKRLHGTGHGDRQVRAIFKSNAISKPRLPIQAMLHLGRGYNSDAIWRNTPYLLVKPVRHLEPTRFV
jgi:hypothetical protein